MEYSTIIEPGDVLSCGDIHGRFDLFSQFLNFVKGSDARVILLGDLIDRGPDDLSVLQRTFELIHDPESWGLHSFIAIRGNHEQMFIDACDGYLGDWARNGGDYENLNKLEPHADWIRQLPYYVTVGDTMFSHAGCYPGRDPADYMGSFHLREQFIWMRQPFLTDGPQFEKWNPNLKRIVFGHTPKFDGPEEGKPYEIPNGVCIDSGAYFTGTLTSYNATRNTLWQHKLEQ